MTRPLVPLALFVVALLPGSAAVSTRVAATGPDAESLRGFSGSRAAAHRELEARFDASLDPSNLRTWMKQMSARPHHVGSPYGRENAEWLAKLFRGWGYETRIDEYQVLLPTPVTRVLELVAPSAFVASLREPPLKEDATSSLTAEQLPVYNAYSIDGDVTSGNPYTLIVTSPQTAPAT